MGMVDKQTVHAGHTINIRIRGEIVGRIQGLDGERDFGTEGVYEIGSMMPQEHVHNKYTGSVTCERFFVRKKDLAKLGMAAVGEEVLKKDIITIEVVDKYTKEIVRSYHGCSIGNYRENFRVNAIAGENASFQYLYAS
jgi:hypothetical protein